MISGKHLAVISGKHRHKLASRFHLAVRGLLQIMDSNIMFDLNLCPPPEEDDQNQDAGIE
jgi:hypothetical protein